MLTHWKKLTNPDYLGAYALEDGKDIILTISSIREETVTGPDGKKDTCPVCRFAERGVKPMVLNATNMKMITKLFNTPYIENWVGKKIQIGVKKVKAYGDIVDALRVRDFLPVENNAALPKCESCGKEIQPAGGMTGEQVAKYTADKYGQALCAACAAKRKKEQAANETDE